MSRSKDFWATNPEVWEIAAMEDLEEEIFVRRSNLQGASRNDLRAFLRSCDRDGGYTDSLKREI